MFIKKKPFIIAEAGVNHNGNLDIAKKLIVGAKKAGSDAIKFQSFIIILNIIKCIKKRFSLLLSLITKIHPYKNRSGLCNQYIIFV